MNYTVLFTRQIKVYDICFQLSRIYANLFNLIQFNCWLEFIQKFFIQNGDKKFNKYTTNNPRKSYKTFNIYCFENILHGVSSKMM